MIHQPLGGINGRATDIAIEAEEIVKTRKRIEALISAATGQPHSFFQTSVHSVTIQCFYILCIFLIIQIAP